MNETIPPKWINEQKVTQIQVKWISPSEANHPNPNQTIHKQE